MANGPYIHTVLGPLSPGELGRALTHEHLLCDIYRVSGNLNHLLNDENLAVEELSHLVEAGGKSVVECTTVDMGRNPEALRRISTRSGVHVVMGTGWYRHAFYPNSIDRSSTAELADIMIRELTAGVNDTGIRAGIIGEIGVNLDFVGAQEERVLRAAARAHLATGAPITTHASMYPVGLQQLDILKEEGADLSKVIIGHCDTFLDRDYHLAILHEGAYVQFDTVGRNHMNPDRMRATALVELLRLGWHERLLLSSDRCHRSDLRAFGGPGYAVVFKEFFDVLRSLGVADDEFDAMTIVNPARVLAW